MIGNQHDVYRIGYPDPQHSNVTGLVVSQHFAFFGTATIGIDDLNVAAIVVIADDVPRGQAPAKMTIRDRLAIVDLHDDSGPVASAGFDLHDGLMVGSIARPAPQIGIATNLRIERCRAEQRGEKNQNLQEQNTQHGSPSRHGRSANRSRMFFLKPP